jgi:hypothetical protein
MRAQSIHQHRALTNQSFPASVQQHGGLLFSRLDRHEPHRRPHNGLADGFRIRGIVLVPLHIGFYVLRRHQPHLMTQRAQLTRPVVRRRARLQPTRQRGNRLKNTNTCARRSCRRRTVAPTASTPCT